MIRFQPLIRYCQDELFNFEQHLDVNKKALFHYIWRYCHPMQQYKIILMKCRNHHIQLSLNNK